MGEQIRIVLADDHPVVREGIRRLLEQSPGMVVVAEASNGLDALLLAQKLTPDVLLLDMEMPDLNGVDVARILSERNSPVRVLALSAYDDSSYIFGVLDSGAHGYLLKDEAPEQIAAAVRGVAAGEEGWLSRRVVEKLARRRQVVREPSPLSDREREALRWVGKGLTSANIAEMMGIAERTVVFHLENAMRKLGARSRAAAVTEAIRRGWLN